jgi:hypothetical protein
MNVVKGNDYVDKTFRIVEALELGDNNVTGQKVTWISIV